MLDRRKITITKLEAAQRQLHTAITLWFTGGDPVSIHTLAYAAYEVIHAVSKQLNPNRRDLLFDSFVVKDEYRAEFNILLKKHANFFKHANKQREDMIEFAPVLTDLFIIFGIVGLGTCSILPSDETAAFLGWLQIHQHDFLTDKGREALRHSVSLEDLEHIRLVPKDQFFEVMRSAREALRREGRIS